jgi:hypothetical protein
MTKQNPKTQNPLGPLHSDSIKRASIVPKARQGDYNTTPGTAEKPIIIAGDGKEKKK